MNKENLKKLVDEKLSINKISTILNTNPSTVRYWLKKYDLKTDGYVGSDKWSLENILKAVEKSKCKSDVLRFLNITTNSGNFQTLDRYVKKYNIDLSGLVYDFKRGNKWVKKYSNEDIFKENSSYSKVHMKKRIIDECLIEYKCQECGLIDEWNGKKIILHLDHINGINDDNKLDNLRFLCPNCHSQTHTYCRGSKQLNEDKTKELKPRIYKRKVERPDIETLKQQISEFGYVGTGKIYGVSDNSIRKWIKYMNKN